MISICNEIMRRVSTKKNHFSGLCSKDCKFSHAISPDLFSLDCLLHFQSSARNGSICVRDPFDWLLYNWWNQVTSWQLALWALRYLGDWRSGLDLFMGTLVFHSSLRSEIYTTRTLEFDFCTNILSRKLQRREITKKSLASTPTLCYISLLQSEA